ncbi:unnamed protein product [Caenorhabditis bovis]|uniref:Uncharacterized protein n=1 Tax=Caenorhabditis bovis TaxID=2654633 RepID=A0A8S1F770_9PELO|nr:unnamed protein product [Caenorhabditis bovis]
MNSVFLLLFPFAFFVAFSASTNNYKIVSYYVKIRPNVEENTYNIEETINFEVIDEVKEIKLKIGKNLDIEDISVSAAEYTLRGNPLYSQYTFEKKDLSYNKKTEILTLNLNNAEVTKKSSSEGSYFLIRCKGKMADDSKNGAIYVTKKGEIIGNLKEAAHSVIPYIDSGKSKINLNVVTDKKHKVEAKGIEVSSEKTFSIEDGVNQNDFSSKKEIGFDQISFKVIAI